MAPRPLETRDGFIERLRGAAGSVARQPLGFGGHHFTHAVVVEDGVWRVRRLWLDPVRVEAYRAKHSIFTPEHAEQLSAPGPEVVLAAASLEELISALCDRPWPLLE